MIKSANIFFLLLLLTLKQGPPNEIFIKYEGISDKPFHSLMVYDRQSMNYYVNHDKEDWENGLENYSYEISREDFEGLKKLISRYNVKITKDDKSVSGYQITIIQGVNKYSFYLDRKKCVELFKSLVSYLRQNNTNFDLKDNLDNMMVRIDW